MNRRKHVDPIRARAMPLERFPSDMRERIMDLVALPYPPARWIYVCDGLAALPSRAWYEWYWQRGLRPERERIPETLRIAVIERDGTVCGICNGRVPRDDVHIDHITPVVRGGPTTLKNLRVTHSRCNLRKGARAPEECERP